MLTIVEPKNASQLFSRLREVEKIQLRLATPDGLEHMRLNNFLSDGPPSVDDLAQVQQMCIQESTAISAATSFIGVTWKI